LLNKLTIFLFSFSIENEVPQEISINQAHHTRGFDSLAKVASPFNNATTIIKTYKKKHNKQTISKEGILIFFIVHVHILLKMTYQKHEHF
jgi:hypothetical protein